ncbi:MAG TPA: bifunctional phosphoribosyl-AMP cyclohydrolase/phosphoribosyl-ATP diphosphatase HisIE [Lysobacter sp.]|nr:bifunctional phosphoribosyl-AMP cyclohydrolase/phosphoribosyl-ATP diphosphatase HisIE [Lysobacter sp.]
MPEPLRFDESGIDWDKQQGLVPAVVQDASTLRVLMLGWMDRDALAHTLATRQATFYSRTRAGRWTKGETSGNLLDVVGLRLDCDGDTLLVLAKPRGPTCHLDRASCFPDAPGAFLGELDALIERRAAERPAGSYTTKLFDAGVRRIAQKVGEEGVETALAAVAQDDAALLGESADLLYHLTVLLRARGLSLHDANDVLRARHAPGPSAAS